MELSKSELGLLLWRACELGDADRAEELLRAGAPMSALAKSARPGAREWLTEEAPAEPGIDQLARWGGPVWRALFRAGLGLKNLAREGVTLAEWLGHAASAPALEAPGAVELMLGRLEALAEAGADLDGPPRGRLLASLAVVDRSPRAVLVRRAIELGASLEAKGQYGETALQLACRTQNIGAIEALLEAGADERARDSLGSSAKDWAMGRMGATRGAFVAALERREMSKELPGAPKKASPRM